MKRAAKWLALALVLVLMLGMTACQPQSDNGDDNDKGDNAVNAQVEAIFNGLTEEERDCAKYELEKYAKTYWNGNVVYNESVMFLKEQDGSLPPVSLMYKADKILAVRDAKLGTLYTEGVDYALVDGKIQFLEGSSMPTMSYNAYYLKNEIPNASLPCTGGGYIAFSEGGNFHKRQVAVTYIHTDEWAGPVPAYKGDKLSKAIQKLKNNEEITIVLFGDSISTGANSSGFINFEPRAASWFEMMVEMLKSTYGNDKINFVNKAVGGTDSAWGVKRVDMDVTPLEPDLVILAFGMNDGTFKVDPTVFGNNLQTMMDAVKAGSPDCEFILVSTMLANPLAALQCARQEEYEPVILGMEKEGVAVANVTEVHRHLMTMKRYWDMTGNNVNHPNDFLARLYAQTLLATLVEGYK